MINLNTEELRLDKIKQGIIEQKVSNNTCKTNLNPQFLFKQSYSGITNKRFVGNWNENGFWISKFRNQLIQLRPDIIAEFHFYDNNQFVQLRINYLIGFSSIIIGLLWMVIFSILIMSFGTTSFIIFIIGFIIVYCLLAKSELEQIEIDIREKILN